MTSSWWAKKLGTEQSAPPSPYPRTAPVPPPYVPPRPTPTQQSAPNVAVTNENIAEVAGLWQGGQATKTEVQNCPNCGSNLFFSRSNAGSAVAPRCYACGYTQGRPMQGMPL